MNKTILLVMLLLSIFSHAQQKKYRGRVGINTITPQATLEIAKKTDLPPTRPQGVIFPKFTNEERDAFTPTTVEGTTIYNLTKKCIDFYDGTKWSCTGGYPKEEEPNIDHQPDIPSLITLEDSTRFLASVYDDNYHPYTPPTEPASWVLNNNPDTTPDPIMNFQGTVDEKGYDVYIPLTATGSATLQPTAISYKVPADKTEDGKSRTLLLSWKKTEVTRETNHIIAKLKTTDGILNLKKLDINNGVGKDNMGVELATIQYKGDDKGTLKTLKVRLIAGILYKRINEITSNKLEHQFVYLPVKAQDGEIWLNNNLGAEYSNIVSPFFSPTTQAGDASTEDIDIKSDYKAYGSLFEWRRDSDGHELINWTSSTTGDFLNEELQNYQYTSNSNPTPNTIGEPCPMGFRTPTMYEQEELIKKASNMWNEQTLRLPASGNRNYDSSDLNNQSSNGWYWSLTPDDSNGAWHLEFDSSNSLVNSRIMMGLSYLTYGFPIRCIKDQMVVLE